MVSPKRVCTKEEQSLPAAPPGEAHRKGTTTQTGGVSGEGRGTGQCGPSSIPPGGGHQTSRVAGGREGTGGPSGRRTLTNRRFWGVCPGGGGV